MIIFVGNLSRFVSEEVLRGLFEPFGEIKSVKIIKDKLTGQSRGFGFVEMADDSAAQQAMAELNDKEVEGRQIRVNEARPQEQRPRTAGGGSRGGFGGGGSRGGYQGGGRGGMGGGNGGSRGGGWQSRSF
jgi:RNA recognition motif-containing protein